jgi:hypothetical protein
MTLSEAKRLIAGTIIALLERELVYDDPNPDDEDKLQKAQEIIKEHLRKRYTP